MKFNYKITFKINEVPLSIPFDSETDYKYIADGKELGDLIAYLIRECVDEKKFQEDANDAIFAHNVNLYDDNDDSVPLYSIKESLQIFPLMKN